VRHRSRGRRGLLSFQGQPLGGSPWAVAIAAARAKKDLRVADMGE